MRGKTLALMLVMSAAIAGCSLHTSNEVTETYPAELLISNTTVVGSKDFSTLSGVDIVVTDGVIVEIANHSAERKAARIIDGSGKYVVPGYVDAHTHPFPVSRSFPQFIHYGVTSILVTGCGACSNENLREIREMGNDSTQIAPRIFHTSQHFTMQGRHPVKTYPSPNWVEGKTVFYLRDVADIKGTVDKVADQPIVGIKLTIEKGPNPPFVEPMPQSFVTEVVKQARARGIKVLAHVSDNDGLQVAQRAGADHLLHFTGVDIQWAEHESIIEDFVERDVHWVTTLMLDKSFLYPLNPDWIETAKKTGLFDKNLERYRDLGMSAAIAKRNAIFAYGEPKPAFESNPVLQKQFKDLRQLHAAGIKLVTGTDVGNNYIMPGYSLHEEMSLLELGGFEPVDILRMATMNAAELVGAADSVGSVETGKLADIVILNSDPRNAVENFADIEVVIKGGNPLLFN